MLCRVCSPCTPLPAPAAPLPWVLRPPAPSRSCALHTPRPLPSRLPPLHRPPPAPGVRREFDVNGLSVLVFWYRNQPYAIESRSPAEGAYAEGFIKAKFTQARAPPRGGNGRLAFTRNRARGGASQAPAGLRHFGARLNGARLIGVKGAVHLRASLASA